MTIRDIMLLLKDKILFKSIFKEFADRQNFNVTEKKKIIMEENIERKGENAGYQHFLLFPNVSIHKASFSGWVKIVTVCMLSG